jgi:hypothetical protein
VVYILATTLVFMLLFFAGTAPDVMKHSGDNWQKPYREPMPAASAPHH